ncbi:cytochrome c oxidase subunit II [Emcibacter sp. SYSU 3D8]|uniref:cytochrome c oxidase subunit II n=1 Tax=Emcibacter sp. SYSU 3D8 TaxID=3133969 RepID=UPI0031FE9078
MSSLFSFATAGAAFADIAVQGEAKPWQMGFQVAATDVMQKNAWFHDIILLPLAVVITIFVAVLMVVTFVKFNAKANPVPSKTTHNAAIEVVWTVIPTIIVAIIGIISVRFVYFQDAPPADLASESGIAPAANEIVLKATGNRWYWEYEYPEEGISFASIMVEDADLKPGQPRLLTVDNHIVIPVNTVIRLQVTANPLDVLHAWTIPSFGVKVDAVPGRLNERWFRVLPGFEGRYYGQCSELCGQRHSAMPITVDVVSDEEYQAWLATTKEAANGSPAGQTTIALNMGAAE